MDPGLRRDDEQKKHNRAELKRAHAFLPMNRVVASL